MGQQNFSAILANLLALPIHTETFLTKSFVDSDKQIG